MVSVVIPTFNREQTIKRAIDSVLNQTYPDIELIVVDDCSADDTEKIVAACHDRRVRLIRHGENQGACAARNTGIKNSQGEYIAFQDSDDIWRSDKLEKQIAALKKYDADICFCKMERHSDPVKEADFYPDLPAGIVPYEVMILNSLASTQTILAKREVCEEFLFDIKVKRMQDYDWIIRAARNHRVCFVEEVLVEQYLQKDSITSFAYEKMLEINELFLEKYRDLCLEYPQFHVKKLLHTAYYKTMLGMRADGECWEIYKISKRPKDFARWFLARIGILHCLYIYRACEK